ncbi:DUF892 family protein [Paraburkholderia strydomiana]|uniref:DUF892 family protein n=1 Tax=Paraburkholderia strydomiana TaxID=1245417 RepID=UPI0038B6F43D
MRLERSEWKPEHLVDRLRDAYAMDKQARSMLKRSLPDLTVPELRRRIDEHLQETPGQQILLQGCLDRLGSRPSAMRDLTGRVAAFGQAVGG